MNKMRVLFLSVLNKVYDQMLIILGLFSFSQGPFRHSFRFSEFTVPFVGKQARVETGKYDFSTPDEDL